MPEAFEYHCFGGRLGDRPVDTMLAGIGLVPAGPEPGDVDVLTCGDGGIWVRGGGAGMAELARRVAVEGGRAVRHYRVRVQAGEEGVAVEVDGATWWPDGRRVVIGGVEDRFVEDGSTDLVEIATQALSVTLEVHEQLHHDDYYLFRGLRPL